MSWDSYIDNLIGHAPADCDKVAIIGLEPASSWTTSAHANHLNFLANEITDMAAVGLALVGDVADSDSKAIQGLQASGIFIEGLKYQFLRRDGKVLIGKKKGEGSITIQASNTAVVVAHTKEGQTQGNTNKAVCIIAEYLESVSM